MQYIVYEYASKGTLLDYLIFPNSNCLEEKHAKIIFKKISRGIEAMHVANICHRDIKLENILLDLKCNPKICDFGFCIKCLKKLNGKCGTDLYIAPEIIRAEGFSPYDGLKADIFSLGITLLRMVTGQNQNKNEFIKCKIKYDYDSFLKLLNAQIKDTSENFQKLITKMLDFDPGKRFSIDQVIDDPWMKEVKESDNIQDNELINEFKKREQKLTEKEKGNEITIIPSPPNEIKTDNRGLREDLYEYFDKDDLIIKEIDDSNIIFKDYIKIKGHLNPMDLMNLIANKIKSEYEDWDIKPNGDSYKFDIEIQKEDDESNEEINQEEIEEKFDECEEGEIIEDFDYHKKTLIIQIILLKSSNDSYLIRFYKKSGDREEYYEKLNNIISIIKKII